MGLDRPKLPISSDGKIKKGKLKKCEETPALKKFHRLGKQWARRFPVMNGNPGLGSWLDSKMDVDD